MSSFLKFIMLFLGISRAAISETIGDTAVKGRFQDLEDTSSLFQSGSTVVSGVDIVRADSFGDLVDEFDIYSKDHQANDMDEEMFATGVDALPEILKDVTIPSKSTKYARSTCFSSVSFPHDVLLIVLGVIGYCIFKGVPKLPSMTEARSPTRCEADDAKKDADPTTLDTDELVQAMYAENKEHLRELLQERSAEASDAVWGCTALHVAADCGCAQAAEALLLRGASPDMKDTWDETPLHFAARSGYTEVCELLIAYGAKLDVLNAQDWTPLIVGAHAGHEAVCRLLLSHGAGVGGLKDEELPPALTSLLIHNMFGTDTRVRSSTEFKSC